MKENVFIELNPTRWRKAMMKYIITLCSITNVNATILCMKMRLKNYECFWQRSSTCLLLYHAKNIMESGLKLNGSGWFGKYTTTFINYVCNNIFELMCSRFWAGALMLCIQVLILNAWKLFISKGLRHRTPRLSVDC